MNKPQRFVFIFLGAFIALELVVVTVMLATFHSGAKVGNPCQVEADAQWQAQCERGQP